MIVEYKATIKCNTKANHPDDNSGNVFTYSDIYTVDTDYFNGIDNIHKYIKHDMALVAGGGYDTDTIDNVKYTIDRV